LALACFKAYDIRGRVGPELNEDIAYRIGRALAQRLAARRVVVGCDVRLSSPSLKAAVINGLCDAGADVLDLGLTGTEEVYFASFHLDVDAGIEITASHNPADYNGMKFVGSGGRPIGVDDEFAGIRKLAEAASFAPAARRGRLKHANVLGPYVDHLLSYVNLARLRPLRIVADAGNGAAGHVIEAIAARFSAKGVPVEFIPINEKPDGNFPNGVPNPLLPENRAITTAAVKQHGADLGIAWDGDFDRCFLFDEKGDFVSGYYVAGLLASVFLSKNPGERFVIDARLDWNTKDIISAGGGSYVTSRTGHTFFKQNMREQNAIYGGEISAHHYFRNFAYCDSGMIPWLLAIEHLSLTGKPLSALVAERQAKFPCSEEINFKVADIPAAIDRIVTHYRARALAIETIDGVTLEFADARFNLRASNTESLLRLNVETRGDAQRVDALAAEIAALI
jgi:phosphomannomutase